MIRVCACVCVCVCVWYELINKRLRFCCVYWAIAFGDSFLIFHACTHVSTHARMHARARTHTYTHERDAREKIWTDRENPKLFGTDKQADRQTYRNICRQTDIVAHHYPKEVPLFEVWISMERLVKSVSMRVPLTGRPMLLEGCYRRTTSDNKDDTKLDIRCN